MESCLKDKTNQWAKKHYGYLNNKPRLKFRKECKKAQEYVVDRKFDKAAEIFRDISNRCNLKSDKEIFEFQSCKYFLLDCKRLFLAGDYSLAKAGLEKLITENKATNRSTVKEAMLILGQTYVQLGDVDKAVKNFLSLMIEHPEAKEVVEVNFFIGYSYMLQGKFEAATEAYNCLIQFYPESDYVGKAQLYLGRIQDMTE